VVRKKGTAMKACCVKLPKLIGDQLDALVSAGLYGSRSQAVREILRAYFGNLYKEIETKSLKR